ncbi:MAG TPA: hypothetical protein VKP69_07640, partial [Isosphaeraceae bacterium]|nr:hypothetical protein [Isosphaeraceae bacterium]
DSESHPSPAPSSPAPPYPTPTAAQPSSAMTPPATTPTTTASPRLVPQPRVSRPITEADPLVTRVTLNRSNDGNQFGMFLQVFSDGTVIDGEGAHRVGPDALKPVVTALQTGDFARLKGHCGGPATDYVEQVHVVVFERSLGRLRANAFSYSGNPQGCDHSVHHLHAALDALQAKISRPMTATNPGTPAHAATPESLSPNGAPSTITLTPSP